MRACLEPGCPQLARPGRSRCELHERQRNTARRRRRTGYQSGWAAEARTIVDAWRTRHGDWCPGIRADQLPTDQRHRATPGHPATDLTCDHQPNNGRGVLCRTCNGLLGKYSPVHPHR